MGEEIFAEVCLKKTSSFTLWYNLSEILPPNCWRIWGSQHFRGALIVSNWQFIMKYCYFSLHVHKSISLPPLLDYILNIYMSWSYWSKSELDMFQCTSSTFCVGEDLVLMLIRWQFSTKVFFFFFCRMNKIQPTLYELTSSAEIHPLHFGPMLLHHVEEVCIEEEQK